MPLIVLLVLTEMPLVLIFPELTMLPLTVALVMAMPVMVVELVQPETGPGPMLVEQAANATGAGAAPASNAATELVASQRLSRGLLLLFFTKTPLTLQAIFCACRAIILKP